MKKQAVFRRLVEENLIGYRQRFQQPANRSITDDAYALYGAWGMYYNGQFAQGGHQFDTGDIYKVLQSLFYEITYLPLDISLKVV